MRERHAKGDAKSAFGGEKGIFLAPRVACLNRRADRRACSQATHFIAVYTWRGRGEGGGRRRFFSLSSPLAPSPIIFFFVPGSIFARLNFLLNELQKKKHTQKNRQLRRPYCVMLNLQSSPWEGGFEGNSFTNLFLFFLLASFAV